MITPSPPRPIYGQIADDLRQRIRSGEFSPGAPLPSERHLRQTYGYSEVTIRRALDLLVRDGIIIKRHGAPTRVRQTEEMSLAGLPPGHKVGARPARDDEAARWDLPTGYPVLTVKELVGDEWMEVEAYPADRFLLGPDDESGPVPASD